MRILHVTPTLYPAVGGIETVVRELMRSLRSRGFVADAMHIAPGNRRAKEHLPRHCAFERFRGFREQRLSAPVRRGAADLARIAQLLQSSDRELMRMRTQAREEAGAHSWESVIHRYIEVYQECGPVSSGAC